MIGKKFFSFFAICLFAASFLAFAQENQLQEAPENLPEEIQERVQEQSAVPQESSEAAQGLAQNQEENPEQQNPIQDDQTITAIKFIGLKKTKDSYLQQIVQKYKGMPADKVDLQEVETVLQAQGIFSETDAEIRHDEEGKLILSVQVKEKISFLPLPFIAYSSNTGVMGGLMLMDTNAFGVKDNYIVGGVFSATMQMGVMSFSKPSVARNKPGFSVSANFSHRENKFSNTDRIWVLNYNSIGGGANASISDKITDHSLVTLGFRYAYVNIDVDEAYAKYEEELKSTHAFSLTAGWSLSIPTLNEWFISTKGVKISGDVAFLTAGDKTQSISGQISIQQPLPLARIRLLGNVSLYYSHDAPKTLWQGQGTVGITIMPPEFRSPYLGGSTLGIEIGLARTKVATFSVYGLYECMMAKEWEDERFLNQGYSAGAKMYLAQIAFPAMALGFTHNVTKNKMKFSVSAGISY